MPWHVLLKNNVMPMVLTSTPYISYQEINVENTDLLDDAWGFSSEFSDVINFLGKVETDPGEQLTARLIWKISNSD
jgi:hypothetical protein